MKGEFQGMRMENGMQNSQQFQSTGNRYNEKWETMEDFLSEEIKYLEEILQKKGKQTSQQGIVINW